MATHPIFDHMRGEHRQLLLRMDALAGRLGEDRAPEAPLSPDLLGEAQAACGALRRHLEVEDESIYEAVRRLVPETAPHLAALRAQRDELRSMLSALVERLAAPRDDDRDEQILVESEDLFELARIHVRKEEALVFGLAERALRPDPIPTEKGPRP